LGEKKNVPESFRALNLTELEARVQRAIATLYARDSDLLDDDASEWTIAHRLAVYLEQEIPGWHVDCEYNRQGSGRYPKRMSNKDLVRPDIILHCRDKVETAHNLLVVEVKKREADSDLGKACEYTKPPEGGRRFQYQFGLALSVIPNPTLHWFADGKEMS
jgi:hypothetical protein